MVVGMVMGMVMVMGVEMGVGQVGSLPVPWDKTTKYTEPIPNQTNFPNTRP